MNPQARIKDELIKAMKQRQAVKVGVLRYLLAAMVNKKIANRGPLTAAQELAVISAQVKSIKESMAQFEKGQRLDLVAKEKAGLKILQAYLPAPLAKADLQALIKKAASQAKDMGQIMKIVMPQVAGRADGAQVSILVKQALSN